MTSPYREAPPRGEEAPAPSASFGVSRGLQYLSLIPHLLFTLVILARATERPSGVLVLVAAWTPVIAILLFELPVRLWFARRRARIVASELAALQALTMASAASERSRNEDTCSDTAGGPRY